MIFKKNKSVASLDKNYLNLCKNAASNDDIFQNFRNLKDYKNILEHVDKDLAVKYLENIKIFLIYQIKIYLKFVIYYQMLAIQN